MKVGTIMTKRIVTISMDDSLRVAREIFNRTKFHHLLVIEDDHLFGVLSDRDLLKAISPNIGTISATEKDESTLNKRVHQVMTRELITLHEDSHIADAVGVFNEYAVSCIPIVDEQNRPVGILSWRDVLKSCVEFRAPEECDLSSQRLLRSHA